MSIAETLVAKPPPIHEDADGVLRVGGTRVTLDTVVHAYEDGADAKEIVRRYSSLKLADVHAVLSYYLENREQVELYLAERERQAEEWRRFWQQRCPTDGLKEELLARRLQLKREQEES